MYKEAAEINFNDYETLNGMFSKMRDREYSEYKSSLSQVHDLLRESLNKSIEDAAMEVMGTPLDSQYIVKVIDAIGRDAFVRNSFAEISASLDELRSPEVLDAPDLSKQLEPETEQDKPDFSQKVEELKSAEYPDDPESMRTMKNAFMNISFMMHLLDEEEDPDEILELSEKIKQSIRILEELSSKKDYQEKIKEFGDEDLDPSKELNISEESEGAEEDVEEDIEQSKKLLKENSTFVSGKLTRSSKEEVSNEFKNHNYLFKSASVLDQESYVNHPILDGLDAPFNFELPEPQINKQVFDAIFDRFDAEISKYREIILAAMNANEKVPDQSVRTKFNDFIYAIKMFDLSCIRLIENKKKSGELSTEDYLRLKSDLSDSMITVRLATDKAYFDRNIFIITSFLTVPLMAYLSQGMMDFADIGSKKDAGPFDISTYQYVIEAIPDPSARQEAAYEEINKLTWNNFKRYIDLNEDGTSQIKNFLLQMTTFKLSHVALNMKRFSRSGDKVNIGTCPVCERNINWSGKAYSREDRPEGRASTIPVYSIFVWRKKRSMGDREVPVSLARIKESDLHKNGPYPPPRPEDYSGELEKRLVSKYQGSLSWKEINDLIYSNDPAKNEEGLHRKAAAFKMLGAHKIADLKLSSIKFSCPFSGTTKDYSDSFDDFSCGLRLEPVGEGKNLLQPAANANPKVLDYTWDPNSLEFVDDELAEIKGVDKEVIEHAKKSLSGGYKFSKHFFSCPAHIDDFRPGGRIKSPVFAIPKAGPAGMFRGPYSPPVKNAEFLDFEEGTFGYMVCNALTSFSLYDRNPGNEGSLPTILKRLIMIMMSKESSVENKMDALDIFDFMIRAGLDQEDLMRALDILSGEQKREPEPVEKESFHKIEEMIKLATITIPDRFEILKDLALICPHGHRFTIGQSLSFSETHMGLNFKNVKNGFSKFKSLYVKNGVSDYKTLIDSGIIKKDIVPELKNFYDEDEVGNIGNLKFEIRNEEGEVEIYSVGGRFTRTIRNSAGYDSMPLHRTYIDISQNVREVANISGYDEDKKSVDLADIQQAKSYQEAENSEFIARNIPGIDPDELEENTMALSRALKAALKIVIVWTQKTKEEEFARRLYDEIDIDSFDIMSRYMKQVRPKIIYYDEEGNELELEDQMFAMFVSKAADRLTDLFVRTHPFLYGSGIESGAMLVSAAALDILNPLMDKGDLDFDVDVVEIYDDFLLKIARDFVQQEEDFVSQINRERINRQTNDLRINQGGKVLLNAYAIYLASEIANIYNEHFSYERLDDELYIGYDIGIDLSSSEKIIELGIEDLAKITEVPDDLVFKNPMINNDEEKSIAMSLENIKNSYGKLIIALTKSRERATSPRNLVNAKNLFLRKLGKNDQKAESIFSSFFPVTAIGYENWLRPGSYIPDPFGYGKKGAKALPAISDAKGQVPLIMNGEPLLDYRGQQETMTYYIHQDSGYDGRYFQVGMSIGKTGGSIDWPIESPSGKGLVSLPIPMTGDSDAAYSALKNLPVSDYRIIIEFDGEPLDITFLVKKGRSEEEEDLLKLLYKQMDGVEQERGLLLSRAQGEDEIDEINNHYDKILSGLKDSALNIPPVMSVTKNSLRKIIKGGKEKWGSSKRVHLALVDPEEALELIRRPHRYASISVDSQSQDRLKEFVIRAYGLELIARIFEEELNRGIDDNSRRSYAVEDVFNMREEEIPPKVLRKIRSRIKKEYKYHLGQYYNILPLDDFGRGSYVNIATASVPNFVWTGEWGGPGRIAISDEVGYPPSVKIMASRLKVGKTSSAEGQFFGLSSKTIDPEKDFGRESAAFLLDNAKESMINYVESYASGEIGSLKVESKTNSEYILKIAKRRRNWERIILTMGFDDIDVEDIIDI